MAKAEKSYPSHVCKRLDALSEARIAESAAEQALTKTRKSLKEQWGKIGWGSTGKHKDLALDYVQTLFQIEYSRARQKELADTLVETVKNAYQEELFDNDELEVLVHKADMDEVVTVVTGAKPATDEADVDQVTMPVGGPSAKEPPKKPALEPAPVHQGVDMHLAASVNELDMPELNKGRLLNAGINTVADAIKLFEDETKHAGTVLNCGEKIVAAIKKAVAAYRDKHRTAMVEKFTTGTGEN